MPSKRMYFEDLRKKEWSYRTFRDVCLKKKYGRWEYCFELSEEFKLTNEEFEEIKNDLKDVYIFEDHTLHILNVNLFKFTKIS
jgi:hypothetical protein